MERKIVEALIANKSRNQISSELHVGKRRIRRIAILAKDLGYLDKSKQLPPYPEALFPSENYRHLTQCSDADTELSGLFDFIKERLELGWRPISVFEELPGNIGRSSFYRFLTRHGIERLGSRQRYAVPEIIHVPGEALLVDWGKLCSAVNPATGKKQTLWAFIGVLGYSRYMMVRLMWTCDAEATHKALASMFDELGGLPERVTSDNPKVFSLEASDYEPLVNPAYERFASHYGFTVECLPPKDPEKKGKVERLVPYTRRLFESFLGDKSDINAAQEFINNKVLLANERKHGTTQEKPVDRLLLEEITFLKKLPTLAYELEEFHEGRVRKDSHVRFRGKYYSVDDAYKGKDVQIIATKSIVHIYFGGKLLDTHDRVTSRLKSKSTKPQHLAPWKCALDDVSIYRSRAQNIGPYTDRVVTTIIASGRGFIDFRRIWGILSLDKRYSTAQVEEACRQALECQNITYRGIRALAECQRHNKTNVTDDASSSGEVHRETNKFVRSINEYVDALAPKAPRKESENEQLGKSSATIH